MLKAALATRQPKELEAPDMLQEEAQQLGVRMLAGSTKQAAAEATEQQEAHHKRQQRNGHRETVVRCRSNFER